MMATVCPHYPSNWSNMSTNPKEYKLVELSPLSVEYRTLASKMENPFNAGIKQITRVQNPFLYGQFLLKKEEYETRGRVTVRTLFHDTAERNIPSIVGDNLDWRLAKRVKFGQGVSFSPFPSYANQQSSRDNGTDRAMIVADVLVGYKHGGTCGTKVPKVGFDTTWGNNFNVYVKYYDNEFYPKYVIFYKNWQINYLSVPPRYYL